MGLMTKVLDIACEGTQRALACMHHIKQLLGHGTRGTGGRPPTPLPPPPLCWNTSSPSNANSMGLDGDTSLGTVQVGGSDTALTVRLLFRMIRELQTKVDVLAERSKNAGIIFDRRAFLSEAEFVTLFIQQNPSGSGPVAFVDIISIWLFGATDSINTPAFLMTYIALRTQGSREGVLKFATHTP